MHLFFYLQQEKRKLPQESKRYMFIQKWLYLLCVSFCNILKMKWVILSKSKNQQAILTSSLHFGRIKKLLFLAPSLALLSIFAVLRHFSISHVSPSGHKACVCMPWCKITVIISFDIYYIEYVAMHLEQNHVLMFHINASDQN